MMNTISTSSEIRERSIKRVCGIRQSEIVTQSHRQLLSTSIRGNLRRFNIYFEKRRAQRVRAITQHSPR